MSHPNPDAGPRYPQQGEAEPTPIGVQPDGRAESFRTEAHRQSAVVATSAAAQDDQDFIDAVSEGFAISPNTERAGASP